MTLARRLLLLVALAIVPPLAIQGWSGWSQRREREAILRDNTLERSRAVQADMVSLANGVRELLVALSQVPAIRDGDAAACTTYLKAVSEQFHEYTLLAANDLDGAIRCSSQGANPGDYSNAERAYYRRAIAANGLAVGDLVVGVVTHQRSIHFALPFRRADGATGGIVLASVDQSRIARQLVTAGLPRGAEALVIDPSGTIVATFEAGAPVTDRWVGQPAPQALRTALQVQEPRVVRTLGLDGRDRLFGALPPDPLLGGMVVATAFDEKRAFADIRASTQSNLFGLFLGGALAMAAALMAARRFVLAPIARLTSAAARVGAGEVGARADLGRQAGAMREVGAAFDRMSEALAAREDERDAAELARRAGDLRLSRLLDATPTGIAEVDIEGRFTYANPAASQILGGHAGPVVGRLADDPAWGISAVDEQRLGPGDIPIRKALAGEAVRDEALRLDGPEANRKSILVDAVPVRDVAGHITGAVMAFQDVSARAAAIQALTESEARFRQLADSAPALIWTTDASGLVTFTNMHHDYLFGHREPSVGGGLSSLPIVESELNHHQAAFTAAFGARAPFQDEIRVRDNAGRIRWLACEGVPRLDDQGNFLGYTACALDITAARLASDVLESAVTTRTAELRQAIDTLHGEVLEREQAEEQLRQAQKMEALGQLTGGIAHDFNNMLQGISGSIELVRRRLEQGRPEDVARFLDAARTSIGRAAALTQRLLAFARRQSLQPRAVDPVQLIEGVADLLRSTMGAGTEVALQSAGDAWSVLCDPVQLESVLLNLAINARDAMPEGGVLAIGATNIRIEDTDATAYDGLPAGDYVAIAITDTGVGMDAATIAHAFEPFFTTKPLGQGTGLGLSQVYGFARQSGGTALLDSTPGEGATVRVLLPRYDPSDRDGIPQEHDAPAPAAPGMGETILLVEDDTAVRTAVAEHLRDVGYRVTETGDGPAALSILRDGGTIDILLTDVGLPGGMNGRQVAEAARLLRPGLPVLFATGYAGSALADQMEPGMMTIGKPYGFDDLAKALRALTAPTGAAGGTP